MEKQESWKPVVNYEGLYEVSNLGRVKSLNYLRTGKEGILKPGPDEWGYLQVALCKNGEKETCKVHILVMRAFNGKCPKGHQVDHINFKQDDNRLENLRYLPAKENASRKSPEGLQNISEANKKKAQDPEWQRKNAEGAKKRATDPEWRKNNAEAAKRRAADPEWQKNAREGAKKRAKPVDQFTLDGIFMKTWSSASDAANDLGINKGNISSCCKGRYKSAGGYIWRFA